MLVYMKKRELKEVQHLQSSISTRNSDHAANTIHDIE